jgi:wyosine [tRNA(Phe)-imidazoG37] synthetase (radical SAM superfamily)
MICSLMSDNARNRMLSITDHRRDGYGMNYIYPVMSRRAGGLSIGVNLNTNNACNWRCIYCQVPGLVRGSAPGINLDLLRKELRDLLVDILKGDFYAHYGVTPACGIRDIAISGNGEPTSAKTFDRVVETIGRTVIEAGLAGAIKLVLITNGSLVQRAVVKNGIALLSDLNGEVWFKLDSATSAGIRRINNTGISLKAIGKNLETASRLCPTWIQTCVFALDGKPPSETEQGSYLQFLASFLAKEIRLKGLLLYGIARPPIQPEASRLSRLPAEWLEQYAGKIRRMGIEVKTSV